MGAVKKAKNKRAAWTVEQIRGSYACSVGVIGCDTLIFCGAQNYSIVLELARELAKLEQPIYGM